MKVNIRAINESFNKYYIHENDKEIANRIRKGKLRHGNSLVDYPYKEDDVADADAYDPSFGFEWDEDEDTMIQIQDVESELYEPSEKHPRTKSHSWGRIWKKGELDKQFEGPKYKVRQDMAKYLDESKVKDPFRIVPTKLQGPKNYDILNSVIGQMSDGMWENTRGMKPYWLLADIDDNCNIVVSDAYSVQENSKEKRIQNPYKYKSDDEIRAFFADKIQKIAKQFMKDDGQDSVEDWVQDNDVRCSYLDYGSGVSVGDAFAAVKTLLYNK